MNLTKYCYNAFVGRMILTRAQHLSIASVAALSIPLQISCNAAVIIAFYKTKQLKSASNWNIAILSFSDCLGGLVSLPLYCVLFAAFGKERVCWYEQLTVGMLQTNSHFSCYTMVVIALQRYLKARPGLTESSLSRKLASKKGTVFTSSLVLLVSILHGIVSTNFFNTTTTNIPKVIMAIINIAPVAAIYICYLRLYRNIRSHVTNITVELNSSTTHQDSTTTTTNQPTYCNELAKTMYFILASFAVCSIPFLIADFVTGWYALVLKVNAPQTVRYFYYMSFWPLSLNGIINALILLYRNKKAAKYIKDHLTMNPCRKSVSEMNSV